MCPLHLFWPPQRSCCYYYCLWSPGPIFIIIIWLFTLYSHLSHLSFNNSLNLDFNPTYVSTSSFLAAAAELLLLLLFVIARTDFYNYNLAMSLSTLISLISLLIIHWIWILIQLMCPLLSFLAAAKICCYCLWSPGPIFIIIIWLFTLYSHLSHLSFNFHWIWVLIQLMCPLHLFMAAAAICCYCLSSPGPIFIIIIWLFTLYSHLSHLSFNNFIEFGF